MTKTTMRRNLFALSALALAGQAGAQVVPNVQGPATSSTVTMFGVVDAAVTWGGGSDADRLRMVSGAHTASRVGFRGLEDLGGGLGAGFWVELGFNADDGTGQASNTNNQPLAAGPTPAPATQGMMFNRRATVSLLGTWGEVRLGRDFTSTYRNRDQADPFTTNGAGASQANAGTIAGVTATRASNMIAYYLPANLGGFFGEAQVYLGENASNVVNDNDGNGFQARLGYAAGPFGIAGAYGLTKYATTATLGDTEVWNVAGYFRFGQATLTAGFYQDQVDQTTELTGKGFIVGGIMPFGPWVLRASYSQYETDAAGDPKTNKIAVGGVYNLSKRTLVYATYAHVDNKGSGTTALNGAITAPGDNSDGFDIGLKHSF